MPSYPSATTTYTLTRAQLLDQATASRVMDSTALVVRESSWVAPDVHFVNGIKSGIFWLDTPNGEEYDSTAVCVERGRRRSHIVKLTLWRYCRKNVRARASTEYRIYAFRSGITKVTNPSLPANP